MSDFSVLICFSAHCQIEVQAPVIEGKGAGQVLHELLHSMWPFCGHIFISEQQQQKKPHPAWENGASAQSTQKRPEVWELEPALPPAGFAALGNSVPNS